MKPDLFSPMHLWAQLMLLFVCLCAFIWRPYGGEPFKLFSKIELPYSTAKPIKCRMNSGMQLTMYKNGEIKVSSLGNEPNLFFSNAQDLSANFKKLRSYHHFNWYFDFIADENIPYHKIDALFKVMQRNHFRRMTLITRSKTLTS
jgi:biopolymer transport protein ExbD